MFRGFPPEAIAFYEGLAADNSKSYWDAHRDTYETCVREPLELLLEELPPEYGDAKVFRPYRDVRFSKDKSPYKLAAAAVGAPDGTTASAVYVELSAAGLRVGGGAWHLDRGQLERARRAIDDPKTGQELEEIARAAEEGGMTLFEPELKTAPRGFPKDHPRIDLLRRKRFALHALHAPGPWLSTPEAKTRVEDGWATTEPLRTWLERHVGPADPVERR
jgi:uncharacterized protein (TIGR02453 family)